jgi:hypothetical protein
MPEPRILFDEMAATAPTMDELVCELSHCVRLPCIMRLTSDHSYAYWMDRNEPDIQAMIFGNGFIGDDEAGIGPQDEWAPTHDAEDIDRTRLFATQPTRRRGRAT